LSFLIVKPLGIFGSSLPITFPRLAQWGILENKIVNQHEFTIEAQSFNEPL
jgi:hypothetical protein